MSPSLAWPPALSPPVEAELLALASDYALSHGLVLRPVAVPPSTSPSTTASIHAPYSLFPSPFPRHLFQQALDLLQVYNALYAHATVDDAFLHEVVGGAVAKVDDFQGRLYDLWRLVKAEGIKQPLHLGLFRSDYLIHSPPGVAATEVTLKQVEFNTISSSFGPLATKVGELHRYLCKSGAYPDVPGLELAALPVNDALKGLAAGLAAGHLAYGSPSAKVLMVVQDDERNAFDQRAIEWELQETHNIRLLRVPFSQLSSRLSLSPSFSLLHTSASSPSDPPTEISVVYYRAGYTPTDYPSEAEWSARLLVERSRAIKCPTVAMQLAGAKKVQQVLAEPGRLDQFLDIGTSSSSPAASATPPPLATLSPTHASLLQSSFTSLYPLDSTPLGLSSLALARSTPEKFVLKPQREGGGNNIYRLDIPPYLSSLAESDAGKPEGEPRAHEGFILMDLIVPPVGSGALMVRAGEATAKRGEVISELGVYGVVLMRRREGGEKGAEVLVNETVGHLLRTKGVESDEGGVAVGFSVIDSPLLV